MKTLANWVRIDLRALAVFRISLGIFMLCDLGVRAWDLRMFYTDFGVMPRVPLIEKFSDDGLLSIHLMSGTLWVQAVLFLIHAVLALLFTVGYRTRLVAVFCWMLLISLQDRNHMVLQGGDILYRVAFFWALFLPLDRYFSLGRDQLRRFLPNSFPHSEPSPSPSNPESPIWTGSVATFAYLMQIAIVYIYAASYKFQGADWLSGEAVYYVFQQGYLTEPLGLYLTHYPRICEFLTQATLWLEAIAPALLLISAPLPWIRLLAIGIIFGLNFGFGLCLKVGPFPWISSLVLLPLVPSIVWQRLYPLAGDKQEPGSIWPLQLALAGLLSIVLAWNQADLLPGTIHFPRPLVTFVRSLNLDQKWDMFAPGLAHERGWWVIPGKLSDGREIDVLSRKPVTWEEPKQLAEVFPTERWRKYMFNMSAARNSEYRLYLGKYLCRNWNEYAEREDVLQTFEIYFVRRKIPPPGKETIGKEPERLSLWRHTCF